MSVAQNMAYSFAFVLWFPLILHVRGILAMVFHFPIETNELEQRRESEEQKESIAKTVITPGPRVYQRMPQDEFEISLSAQVLGYGSPDSICGYVNKGERDRISISTLTCPETGSCVVVDGARVQQTGYLACCTQGEGCTFQYRCFNSQEMSSCDTLLHARYNTIKCTHSEAPWCATLTMEDYNANIYECTDKSPTTSSLLTMYTSPSGEADRPWTPVLHLPGAQTNTKSFYVFTTFPTLHLPNNTEPERTPVAIAPVIGGAVGGVAILAGLGIGIAWLILRERQHRRRDLPDIPYLPPGGKSKSELPDSPLSPFSISMSHYRSVSSTGGGMPAEMEERGRLSEVVGSEVRREEMSASPRDEQNRHELA